ncbi:MoaD/ThiS family protein [Puniceicoccaceae bacterium K14]|nr:MoaD/ThiS family protein [Puniceicoccaceae bacterium K14]
MSIDIQYFAILKDQSGLSSETLTEPYKDPAAAYQALREKHNFTLRQENLKVAINDEFANWDTPLKEGDSLVFIPPVAGG